MCFSSRRRGFDLFVFSVVFFLTAFLLSSCGGGSGGGSNNNPPPPSPNPTPTVSSVSPSSATAGAAATTVTITGSGFIQTSTVQWNQTARPTTFVSSTQLQAAITAADLAAGGTAQITVVNPTPGGGTSSASAFTINNPAPQVSSISPTTITILDGGSTLTVNGSGFVSTSTITWNGTPRTTTFVSSTQLQASILGADVSVVGAAQIGVSNPAPGGGASSSTVNLPIVYPVPVITALSPSAVAPGGPAFTLTVTGTGFAPTSVVQVAGVTRATAFVSPTTLRIGMTATDIANPATIPITVVTGTPGGGTSAAVNFTVASFSVPTITSITPNSITVNSPDTVISIQGTGFTRFSTVQVGSSTFNVTSSSSFFLNFTLPAANLTTIGSFSVTVSNPATAASNALTLSVVANPVPTLNFLNPTSVAVGSPGLTLTVSGSNFVPGSVVQWNGSPRPTTFVGSFQLTATIPTTDLQSLGNNLVTVFNPTPGGGTSSALALTTFLPVPANDLVYNPANQLLYASVPSSGGPALGNSVVSIDPYTGNLGTPIFVGSEPGRMALSSDGGTLWVGLNGASAVRKIDLATQTPGLQIALGNSQFNGPNIAQALAVMPGQPDTIAVATGAQFGGSTTVITIYDSGVARAKTSTGIATCCAAATDLLFNSTGTTLYELAQGFGSLTVDSTGITAASTLNANVSATSMRIDNGRAYLSSGIILDVTTGAQLGVFSVSQGQNANGPVAPDSALGEAFVLVNPNFSTFQINAYDISNFTLKGSLPIGGVNTFPSTPKSLVRWGQDGLAFITGTQVYILRSPLVKDLSSSLADLNVSASVPASGTTGTDLTYTLTVNNAGPVAASPATLIDNIPNGSTLKSVSPSQGACSSGAVVRCNLGTINSGSSVTVTIVVTPLAPGTLTNTATVTAPQGDPNTQDNSVVSNSSITGTQNNPAPSISLISPMFVQAGSASFTLTVTGSGFNSSSTVQLNNTALPTTFADASHLTATVDASNITALGWAAISVSNPSPGGGASSALPLSIFQAISLDVNRMTFDPFTQKLYASIPSTATQVVGNSIVAIDPFSGSIGAHAGVGSEPNPLAESPDGKYLYIGLDGAKSLTRVDLTSGLAQSPVFPIVENNCGTTTQLAPLSMAALPGNDDTVAIATSGCAGIGIFDISGSNITARTNFSNFDTGIDLTFADTSTLYADNNSTFLRFKVDANGLTKIDATSLNGFGSFNGSLGAFRLANGLIYGFSGGIVNPASTPPAPIAQLAVATAQGQSQTIVGTGVAPEPAAGRVFIMGETIAGSANPLILAYDTTTFDLVNLQQFTGLAQGADLVRWGRDGLAWHTTPSGSFGNNTPGKGELILLRGPFVLPQWFTANATPGLTSTNPTSVAHGSGNLILAVSGSNFVPGAVALWNNNERTTTFVDSSHLNVAIPASDLAQAGTATVVANNPGSSNSGSVSFTIQ